MAQTKSSSPSSAVKLGLRCLLGVFVSDHQASIDFYKVDGKYDMLRDVNGLTPVANIEDTQLGVCRPNS